MDQPVGMHTINLIPYDLSHNKYDYSLIHCSNASGDMMESSNGNIYRVTAPLCGKSPITGEFSSQRPVTRSCGFFSLIYAWINGWVNNREACGLKRHHAHYDVTVMSLCDLARQVPRPVSAETTSVDASWINPAEAISRSMIAVWGDLGLHGVGAVDC